MTKALWWAHTASYICTAILTPQCPYCPGHTQSGPALNLQWLYSMLLAFSGLAFELQTLLIHMCSLGLLSLYSANQILRPPVSEQSHLRRAALPGALVQTPALPFTSGCTHHQVGRQPCPMNPSTNMEKERSVVPSLLTPLTETLVSPVIASPTERAGPTPRVSYGVQAAIHPKKGAIVGWGLFPSSQRLSH